MEAYINKENLAYFFLHFSHESIIVPMVIIGCIWANRGTFSHVICLVLSSMILSASLKYTFKIPLSPHLGIDGFAFPSGISALCPPARSDVVEDRAGIAGPLRRPQDIPCRGCH